VLLSSPSLPGPSSLLTSGVAMSASDTSLSLSSLGAASTASTSAWGGASYAALASLRLRALGPSRRIFVGVGSCSPFNAVALITSAGRPPAMSSPAATRGNLARHGTLTSKFALTRKLSVSTSPFPDLIRDPPAAPPASTPTNVGFTIVFFRGVVAIVWFLLELAGLRMLPGKKVISRTAF
jgi:hypothetical protein